MLQLSKNREIIRVMQTNPETVKNVFEKRDAAPFWCGIFLRDEGKSSMMNCNGA